MKKMIQATAFVARNLLLTLSATLCFSGVSAGQAGYLDPSFGVLKATPYRPAGVVGDWPVSTQFESKTFLTTSVATRKDGSVIVVNQCTRFNPSANTICVTALTAAGVPIPAFGAGGRVDLGVEVSTPASLVLDRNENIWISGTCADAASLFKLSPTGVLIDRLGSNANASKIVIAGMYRASTMDMTYDDKFFVGGTCASFATLHPCAIRMNPNGTPDATFNGGNVLIWGNDNDLRPGILASGTVLKIKAFGDGRAYAAGNCSYERQYMCLAVIETNGSLNLIYTPVSEGEYDVNNFHVAVPPGSSNEVFSDLAVQTDGSAVLLGRCTYAAQNNRDMPCLTRVCADVMLDTRFGDNGYVAPFSITTPDNTYSRDIYPYGLVLREDGTMIVASNCKFFQGTRSGLCLVALTARGALSNQLGPAALKRAAWLIDLDVDSGSIIGKLDAYGLGAVRYSGNAFISYGYCTPPATVQIQACAARISLDAPNVKSCGLDVDGDGRVSATSDGLMLIRGMFRLAGDALIRNAVAPSAPRATGADIGAYLRSSCSLQVPPS